MCKTCNQEEEEMRGYLTPFLSFFDNKGVTTNRFCIINYKKQLTWELKAGMAEYGNKISVFLFIKKIPQG